MRKTKIFLTIFILLLVYAAIRVSGVSSYLTFDKLQEYKVQVKDLVDSRYFISVLVFIIAYVIVAGLSIPGASALTMLGGFIFSTIPAVIYTNIGATSGAVCIFILSRYLLGGWIQARYKEKLNRFNREIEINGANYLLTLRFIPLFPFWMINILSGFSKIPLKTFIWTTSLGIIPGSLVYSFIGSRLNYINSPKDILSYKVLIAFLLLALFSILPVVLKKHVSIRFSQGANTSTIQFKV
ncbi:MAG: hypothetical protein A3J83_08625 [Elusimicrobia bacterium RIFOXYA2_FULL_40_6]|nr:MAG: hypothetical protein A3J83_08625 [Elusimicrobia bacterium RIFOXYA2_FULL_40_6]